jgi:hypothetical protein
MTPAFEKPHSLWRGNRLILQVKNYGNQRSTSICLSDGSKPSVQDQYVHTQRALLAAEQRTRTWRQNVCHAAIGSENFVARTVLTGPRNRTGWQSASEAFSKTIMRPPLG